LSKITNDGLTRTGTGCFIGRLQYRYAYGNGWRQRVKLSVWLCKLFCC